MAGIVMFGKNTNTGPSPGLWGLAPRDVFYDPAVAYGFSQQFLGLGDIGTTAALIVGGNGWIGFGDTGATAVSGAQNDELGGTYSLASDADNESAAITTTHAPFKLTKAAEEFFFECRMNTSTIAVNALGFYVGLMDTTTLVNDVPIIDTDALADINQVGFHYPGGDTTTYDTGYTADGVTAVKVKDAAGTIAAATYIKFGMHLKKGLLRFFVDGEPLADTKTVPDATGTDFPADAFLRPVIGVMHGASVAGDITIDWLHAYQLRAV